MNRQKQSCVWKLHFLKHVLMNKLCKLEQANGDNLYELNVVSQINGHQKWRWCSKESISPIFSPWKLHKAMQRRRYNNTNSLFSKQFSIRVEVKQGWMDRHRRKNTVASDFRRNQQNPLLKHEGHFLRCKIQMPCDNNGTRMLVLGAETPWDLAFFWESKWWHKQGIMPISSISRKKTYLAESESRDLALWKTSTVPIFIDLGKLKTRHTHIHNYGSSI